MAIRDDQKLQVQQATDIVRLIGEQVALRPKGREFVGLCPFHEDKNPSMYVSPAKQIYKCFACGAGGDVFTFVTQYHKMTFPEALRFLADRAGIKLEPMRGRGGPGAGTDGEDEGPTDRQRIAAANAQAVEFFRALYRHREHGQVARDYVDRRGISPEMVEAFQIGYAPDRWDGLATTIAAKGWDAQGFLLAGLISPRNRHSDGDHSKLETQNSKLSPSDCYDRLRHRLIFPIFDAIGRPIAFGGRKLRDEDEPKYLNSPETALFNKSATLYGIHLAKKAIIRDKTAVIVEGYTDVIACHQAGVSNVVATLGTALTADHVRELRRYADKVVLIFDADAAGQKAADRAVELFLTGDLDVAIAELPEGPGGGKLDPAELMAREDGLDVWHATLASAKDALAYQFERVREQMAAADTVTGRQRIAEGYVTQLAQMGLARMGAIRRALVVQRLADLLGMSESAVNDLLRRAAPRRPTPGSTPGPGAGVSSGPAGNALPGDAGFPMGQDTAESSLPVGMTPPDSTDPGWGDNVQVDVGAASSGSRLRAVQRAERQLIGGLLRRPELFGHTLPDGRTLDEAVTPGELVGAGTRRLYDRLYAQLAEHASVTLASLLADLAAAGEHELAGLATEADLEIERIADGNAEREVEVVLAAAEAILNHHREQAYQSLRKSLSEREESRDQAEDRARVLRELLEHRREHPSPVRIARLSG